MSRIVVRGGLLLLSLLVWCGSPLQAGAETIQYRLAVVRMSTILREAPQAEAASNSLRERFARREETLGKEQEAIQKAEEDFLANRSTLPEDQLIRMESELRTRQRDLKRSREDLREEVRLAKDQELTKLQENVANAIEAIREREQIDIVFRESDYIVASKRVDITRQVLDYLQQQFNQGEEGNLIQPGINDESTTPGGSE
ncbi:MAG: OmpH family outer membrane protein [Thiolinea sp.]